MANKYYEMALLRNDSMFQQMMEQVVISYARTVETEASTVPNTAARKRMAADILSANSLRRPEFVSRSIIEAVVSDSIRQAAVSGGPVQASAIPENVLEGGIASIWNKVMYAVWPDVGTGI